MKIRAAIAFVFTLPYACGTCGRRFRWDGMLDAHLRRLGHSGGGR